VTTATAAAPTEPAVRVSTIELFFDLVFVFTITQLTALVEHHPDPVALLQVLIMLGVIWWMYAGYAWLTNAVAPSSTSRRTLLLVGMGGFLVVAIAVPDAFGATGWAFGLGYFVVNAVHTVLFVKAGGPGVARAMARLAPLNLLSATLVLVGGFTPTGWRSGLWAAAFAIQIAAPYLHPIGGFHVSPAHFVERHGLVIIVALGESIVAVGAGAAGLHLDLGVITVALLGLTLSYYLYWAYFGGDDVRAERALAGIADPGRRARTALNAYGYAHYPMLLGIVLLAAGVEAVLAHPFEPLRGGQALLLSGGVAVFLLADLAFRRILSIGRPWYRLATVAGVLAAVPMGRFGAVVQLTAMVAVVVPLLGVEGWRRLQAERAAGGVGHGAGAGVGHDGGAAPPAR
jgi:low temperature requirement protein LtrA